MSIKFITITLELFFLILGVYFPLATMKEFWLFSSEFSILSISYKFLTNNEYILFFIVFFFGLVFPLIKIMSRAFNLKFIFKFNLHKFSMIDIFLLSFLVFVGKSSSLVEIQLGLGFYYLVTSILIGYSHVVLDK